MTGKIENDCIIISKSSMMIAQVSRISSDVLFLTSKIFGICMDAKQRKRVRVNKMVSGILFSQRTHITFYLNISVETKSEVETSNIECKKQVNFREWGNIEVKFNWQVTPVCQIF